MRLSRQSLENKMNTRLADSILEECKKFNWEHADYDPHQVIAATVGRCIYFLEELKNVSDEQHRYGVIEAIETIEREFGL